MTAIAPLPPWPDPSDSLPVFNAKAFAAGAALPDFINEANAQAVENNANAVISAAAAASTTVDAAAAASSAAAAAASAGAAMWVSGSYSEGQGARSPTNSRVYIARTTGAKPTDPASDPTNWRIASGGSLPDWPYAGTTASPPLGERSRFTNVAAVAVTVPLPTGAGEEWAGLWENGLYTNSYDIGVATLKHNGVTLTGVITNNRRLPIHLVSVGANTWRFAS